MTEKSRNLPLSRRGMNFETLMWFFTRLSALGMYAFILTALIGALVMGARTQMNFADVMRWSFTPNGTHVQNTNVSDLEPWVNPFWRLMASGMVLLAVAHGVHGLVVVADDYIVSTRGRLVVRLLSIVCMLSMIVISLFVIWTS